jgi:hypothetical protein
MMEDGENIAVIGSESGLCEPERRRGLRVWMSRVQSIQYPLALAVGSMLITFAFGLCALMAVENKLSHEGWLGIWKRWDASSYVDIAQNGYPHEKGQREFLIVFLPVYPLVIRIAHSIISDWNIAALVVSNLCCAGAFIYFFLLCRLEFNQRAARRAVLFLAVFPTAYFLHVGYSESIFMFLTIAAFYHARRGQWMLCGVFGMLATGSRVPGIVILPPLVWEYLQQKNFRWRKIRWDCLFLVLVPVGSLAYLYINYLQYGNALHFLDVQRTHWGAFLRSPFPSVRGTWHAVLYAEPSQRVVNSGGVLIAFIVATCAVIVAPFRLRPIYSLYLALSWIVIFCNNFPICAPRYLLAVFPLYMLMAQLFRRDWLRHLVIFCCILFYALLTTQLVRGWWAF